MIMSTHRKTPVLKFLFQFSKMADEATLWTEEKLTTLKEKIITRALDE